MPIKAADGVAALMISRSNTGRLPPFMNAARKSQSRYSFHSFRTALAICLAVADSQVAFISSRCRSIFLI
jgi:hypothetical protein